MSFDNPSRKASPRTTLKRTVKTKSLRLVRFCQSVSARQQTPSFNRELTLATYPYGLSAVVAASRLEMQMKSMAMTWRAKRGDLLNDPF
jgi:hypothetical protein